MTKDTNQEKIVLVHCQKQKKLDVNRIMSHCSFIHAPVVLSLRKLIRKLAGVVQKEANIFVIEEMFKDEIMHIIDRGLLLSSKRARIGTGCASWYVEFDPKLLLGSLSLVLVSTVTENI